MQSRSRFALRFGIAQWHRDGPGDSGLRRASLAVPVCPYPVMPEQVRYLIASTDEANLSHLRLTVLLYLPSGDALSLSLGPAHQWHVAV